MPKREISKRRTRVTAIAVPGPAPLVQASDGADDAEYQRIADELSGYSHASSTQRAYRSDLKDWETYARSVKIRSPFLPILPIWLRGYLAQMVERKLSLSTIRRRCAAITCLHTQQGWRSPMEDPEIIELHKSISRRLSCQSNKKERMTASIVSDAIATGHVDLRDRAILLFGICTAFRRSEIVTPTWDDLKPDKRGFLVHLSHSKTDQEGKGSVVGILEIPEVPVLCPVAALHAWRSESFTSSDARVFPVCDRTIARTAKRAAELAGFDPDLFGGHSFRSGFATNAAERGVAMELWMKHTRHISSDSAKGYAQSNDAMANPGAEAMRDALREAGARTTPTSPSPTNSTTLKEEKKK